MSKQNETTSKTNQGGSMHLEEEPYEELIKELEKTMDKQSAKSAARGIAVGWGLEVCGDVDLPYEEGNRVLTLIHSGLINNEDKHPEEAEVMLGLVYWKSKFEALKACEREVDVVHLVEQYMFTDPKEIRDKYNMSKYNVVQISMKIFINAVRNKIWSFPRFYSHPMEAIHEAYGVKGRFERMNEICNELCMKHIGKSLEEYLNEQCPMEEKQSQEKEDEEEYWE